MKNTTFKAASLALYSLLCLCASPAFAGWGSSGGYYGGSSGGYYGSSGGSSGSVVYYGSSGGSSGHRHFTPVRSVLRGIHNHIAAKIERHHARRAYYGSSGHGSSGYGSSGYTVSYGSSGYSSSYGSSGYGSSGYSTSYGSSGGYTTSYGSSGGSYGSSGGVSYGSSGSYGVGYGSSDDVIYYGASNTVSNPVVNVASSATIDDAVYLTVNVPSGAKVYVNDKLTTSTGSVRQFVSRGLVSGKTYKFDVRAELATADGQIVTENKTLVVGAGAEEQLQFAFAETKANVNTALTVNVPEGAKVTLAGNPTKATGAQRTFQSSHLKLGESWDDYTVEVEHEGQVKRQSIRLIGGDQLALTFDFDQSDRLASR